MVASGVAPEYPNYIKNPIKWLRYHSHWRPHLFYSLIIGLTFPILAIAGTPLRRKYWYSDHVPLPNGYPSM
ncbi:hypothetical protein BN7_2876 [Wickerhamomyces ciferrii]|uniref:Uncharacterized protein n=1 Tax=Wickerhamomyces ciferrii (strain ATCC 14091 / BCRC 22168 / CBS 111 / JCM 3599 / NBRC 0793 / NRRL Y-1031 F-60-10) TaxID=1206466 RepID=K0KQ52_WICCF|nr:uncharacterized protein BN7_2876 [Wickerhamomyces ciferrii]CCH43328.1 hypothetical protein BN7_2876 [Wickerhamomyces ciferrii]